MDMGLYARKPSSGFPTSEIQTDLLGPLLNSHRFAVNVL